MSTSRNKGFSLTRSRIGLVLCTALPIAVLDVQWVQFRITPDLPQLTFPQLTHLLSRRRSTILALHNGRPEYLKNILSKSSLEPLSRNFRRLRVGLSARPHF